MSDVPTDSPVAVVGGGPVGLTTALVLSRMGVATLVISPPPPRSADRRTAALFAGSWTLLQNLGLGDLAEDSAPLTSIRLIDGRGGLLRAPEMVFTAAELELEQFGFNVPNALLTARLSEAIEKQGHARIVVGAVETVSFHSDHVGLRLADGRCVTSRLVVGADGRGSRVRTAAGIASQAWDYPQAAIVTSFAHHRPHHGVSTEFHRPHGPLTTVPLPGRSSSLVWVDAPDAAQRLLKMGDDAFRDALAVELDGLLGSLGDVGPRAMFPLSAMKAATLGRGRVALVGEAAHVIPPIGAQGLNLGLRDAAVLAECLTAGSTLEDGIVRYAEARALDVASRIAAIDGLNRSLLSELLPVHLLRGAGLLVLKSVPALRRAVVREGLQPSAAIPRAMLPGGLDRISQQRA